MNFALYATTLLSKGLCINQGLGLSFEDIKCFQAAFLRRMKTISFSYIFLSNYLNKTDRKRTFFHWNIQGHTIFEDSSLSNAREFKTITHEYL